MVNSSEHYERPGIRPFGHWIEERGLSRVTGWRWRKNGWIKTINISGRVYVSTEAIAEFEARAKRGEFAKTVCPPIRVHGEGVGNE